ncbi:uncharacterized protein LOC144636182 [Oculina patagonica]
MTNKADVEQNIPAPIKKVETKKLKADGSSPKAFNQFSRAALKGKGRHKSFGIPMTTVPGARVVHDIPVLRKRHETERAEGFSSISETVHPFYMSAEAESIQFQPRPSTFLPVPNPTASQLAQTKKDDDWFPQNEVKVNLGSNNEEQGFFSRTIGRWFRF